MQNMFKKASYWFAWFKFSSKKADGNNCSTDHDKTVKSICAYDGVTIIILATLQY